MIKNTVAAAVLTCCACTGAMAFNSSDFPTSVVGSKTTFGTGTIGGGSLGPGALSVASDGTILAKGPVSFSGGGGLTVQGQLASRIAKPAVGAIVGRFLLKAIPVVAAGVAIFDLAKELGYGVSANNSVPVFTKTFPGFSYSVYGSYFQFVGASTPAETCARAPRSEYASSIEFQTDPNLPHGVCVVTAGYDKGNRGIIQRTDATPQQKVVPTQEVIDFAAAKIDWPVESAYPRLVKDALDAGEVAPATPEVLTGPAKLPDSKTVTPTSTGSTVVTNVTNNTYNGPSVTTTVTSSTQNFAPDGQPVGAPVVKTTDAVLTPVAADPKPPEIKVCGLSTDTACKIDELDTPKPDPVIDGKKVTDDITKPLRDFAADPEKALPQLPQLNWAFTLPSGCVPISIPAFAPFLQTIDVCQFQPMFHDVMSMVWVMGALFGAISMFWRNTLSQN